jgi:hypothetical protein
VAWKIRAYGSARSISNLSFGAQLSSSNIKLELLGSAWLQQIKLRATLAWLSSTKNRWLDHPCFIPSIKYMKGCYCKHQICNFSRGLQVECFAIFYFFLVVFCFVTLCDALAYSLLKLCYPKCLIVPYPPSQLPQLNCVKKRPITNCCGFHYSIIVTRES